MVSKWEGTSKTAYQVLCGIFWDKLTLFPVFTYSTIGYDLFVSIHGIKADEETDVNYILYLEISQI